MCHDCCRLVSPQLQLLEPTMPECGPTSSHPVSGCAADERTGLEKYSANRVASSRRRRHCHAGQCTLPTPPLLPSLALLLIVAVVVTETAAVGQLRHYRRQASSGDSAMSLSPMMKSPPSAAGARRPFSTTTASPAGSSERQTDDETVDLSPSYGSREHHAGSRRLRRELVEHCATKISGSGYFMTPHYPQLMADGTYTCFWQLSVVYSGQTVSLDLSDLQTSDSGDGAQPEDCGNSYVAVADLRGHVDRYCRPQPRPILVGENVYVWASGHAAASLGLRASFLSEFAAPNWNPAPSACGGRLQAGDALTTPGYPGAYPLSRTCFWAAAAKLGRRLTLVFDSFDVGRYTTCENDYVAVWTTEGGLLPRFCGSALPANISTKAYIFVFFSSDGADDSGATGFAARFVSDEEAPASTTATVAITTAGGGQLAVSTTPTHPQSTSVAPSQPPPPATSAALQTAISASLSPSPWQSATSTGGLSVGSRSNSPSSAAPTRVSTSPSAGGSGSASPSPAPWSSPADGIGIRTLSTVTAAPALTTSVGTNGSDSASTEPLPNSSSNFDRRTVTPTVAIVNSSSTIVTTKPSQPASTTPGIGSRSPTRPNPTHDSALVTVSPASVPPEPEVSSSPPSTTQQQDGGGSVPAGDVSLASTSPPPPPNSPPISTVVTKQHQSESTARQPTTAALGTTPNAGNGGNAGTTQPPATRRRCRPRQKPTAAIDSQATEVPPH